MNDPRGSIWRKWDLHVHTPSSHLNNSFGSFDEYVKKLFKSAIEHDISAIGITDYYCIDGYKELREYIADTAKMSSLFTPEEIATIGDILILPNIEFRINVIVDSNKINFHVLFSNEVPLRDIEEHFLHDIKFDYDGNPQSPNERRKLKLGNLAELGRKLKADHEPFKSQDDLVVGMNNAFVNYGEIKELLQDALTKFNDKYLIGVPSDEHLSKIDWNDQCHQSRKVIIQSSDFLFAANPKTVEWALGRKSASIAEFQNEFKTLKPCLHGSDAHDYDRLFKPDKDRYCWIKADTTFEGLRQILFEPEGRVRIQRDNPQESEPYAKSNKLSINLPDELEITDNESKDTSAFCLSGKQELNFSNNLTCIIGGRGSGKSTLGHLLYNCFKTDKTRLEQVNSPLLSLVLKPSPLNYLSEHNECDGPEQTEFYFQNEIEKAARDLNQMSVLITARLERLSSVDGDNLESLRKQWDGCKSDITALVNSYDNITQIRNDITIRKQRIEVLTTQTEVIQSHEYKTFQGQLKILSDHISNFNTYKEEHDDLIVNIDDLIEYMDALQWSSEQGRDIIVELKATLTLKKALLKNKFQAHTKTCQQMKLTETLTSKKTELARFLETKGLSPENIHELTNANQKLAELNNEINTLKKKQEPHSKTYNNRQQYIDDYRIAFDAYRDRYREVSTSLQERLTSLSSSDSRKTITFDLEDDKEQCS